MACYSPLRAYRTASGGVVFQELQRHGDSTPLDLPCGQCIGCRVQRAQDWALRCRHEASLYDASTWVTLTYDDAHLPAGNSLNYRHFQLFMKSLRFQHRGQTIRYYMCGEYGETTQRPHYHACLFNIHFPDQTKHKTVAGKPYYISPTLTKLWPHGSHLIAPLTPQNAQYTALYITEKITGDAGDAHYGDRVPPFNRMSLKPAIGSAWLERYIDDMRTTDSIRSDGQSYKPPKFYDRLHKRRYPESYKETQFDREERSWLGTADKTPDRLKDRETCAKARLTQKARTL